MTDKEMLELIRDLDAALQQTEDTQVRLARALEHDDIALAHRHLEAIEASVDLREQLAAQIAASYEELEGPVD